MKKTPNRSLAIPAPRRDTRLQLCLLALLIVAAAISLPVAAQGMPVPQPSPGLMPNPAAGKTLFEKNCASCHGANLQGSDKGPPMLSKIYEPSHHGDAAFQLAVKNGSRAHHWKFGDMAPVPGLSPDDVAQITAYVRLEQRKAGIQ
ncbi:MAG: putative bifunctional cbb3-type cytochrome c oxidase subunit II/cytochrome c [Candidatus Accumulibacter regalis]|uniref:Bifunctional cbb3-type cytochrome c oxidase subunit II/cytochrome c n=1 Tax=Accumulibacter regalis TaxID=522306 RepID=A0A011QJ95_ACCRE|nr:cytochrome c [Accumulibacter sp.]EXI89427.1 MAG: putative bifunctional cbb3-type cytochrome c oxidase subunit II/cytochrome c [Candidatus Accumulibacter regalis]